jgi:hypothetical protein
LSAAPLIILAGANKGGVGKTTVCRTLCDYMDVRYSRGLPPRVFDGQFPKGDLALFRTTAQVVNVTDIQDQMRIFDDLAGVTVVDVAGGLLSYTLRALDQARLLDDVKNGDVRLVLVHVLGPTVTSMSEIEETTALIGAAAKHFVVKNYVNETKFFEWDTHNKYAVSLQRLAQLGMVIEVPHLDTMAAETIQDRLLSFETFANDKRSRTLSGRVRTWLDQVWAEFDRVGIGAMIAEASMRPEERAP